MQIALGDAMVSANDASPLFNCSSGNCTFRTYSDYEDNQGFMSHASLGMCSKCSDLYELVEKQSDPDVRYETNYSLPVVVSHGNNMRIILNRFLPEVTYLNVAAGMNFTWLNQAATSEFHNRARWSIANITLLGISTDRCEKSPDGNITCPHGCISESYANRTCHDYSEAYDRQPTDYAAAACIMYPCIRYYRAEFKNSKPEEKVVWEVPLRKQINDFNDSATNNPLWSAEDAFDEDWKGLMQPCLANGTLFTSLNVSSSAHKIPNPTQLVFHAKDWALDSVRGASRGINMTVPADCVATLSSRASSVLGSELQDMFTFNCTKRYGYDLLCNTNVPGSPLSIMPITPLLTNGTLSIKHINDTMESIATRITNEIRKVGRGPFSAAQPLINGTAWGSRACVRIAWKWLVFPGTLLLTAAILLLVTMASDNKRRNVWKSSILPLLLKDQPGVEKMGLKDLNKTASGLEVKIEN
ncbi:hypothetical protein LB507_011561 [Fusarium sp. FIESC RH6]|nr:hypothetical protein LB507_011561 [Fusarium sp. FIESC RH6]